LNKDTGDIRGGRFRRIKLPKLSGLLFSKTGKTIIDGTIVSGILAFAYLVPETSAAMLFLKSVFTNLGMTFLTKFISEGDLDDKNLDEVLLAEINKIQDSLEAQKESGLSREDIAEFKSQVEKLSSLKEKDWNDLAGNLQQMMGDEFSEMITSLPKVLQSQFDSVLDRIDKVEKNVLSEFRELKNHLPNLTDVRDGNLFIFGRLAPTRYIFGRDKLVDDHIKSLNSGEIGMLCLHGMGGIGKSTIASMILSNLHSANGTSQRFDRFIWYDMREIPDIEPALKAFLLIVKDKNLQLEKSDRPLFEREVNLLRTALARNPVFIVLDNVDSAMGTGDQAGEFIDARWEDLLDIISGTKSIIVVTSREMPSCSPQACDFDKISGIGFEDAKTLLKRRGVKDDDSVLRKTWETLSGHPMALMALAEAVRHTPSWGGYIANAGEIMDAVRKCTDKKKNPFVLLDKIIDSEQLPDDTFRILTSMSVLLRPETSDAIYALCPKIDESRIEDSLNNLVNRSLVRIDAEKRPPVYSLHPLIEEVAKGKIDDLNDLHELMYHYYESIETVSEPREPSEVEHLILAARHALEIKNLNLSDSVLHFKHNLANKLSGWGRSDIALPLHRQELKVAEETGIDEDIMDAAGCLGQCFLHVCDYSKAIDLLNRATKIAREIGDRQGIGAWLGTIGQIHQSRGENDQALEFLNEALEIAREIGDRYNEGAWLGVIGQIYQSRRENDQALEFLNEAFEIAREIGDRKNEGVYLGTIGQMHQSRGENDQALEFLNEALEIAREIGDRYTEGGLLGTIGQIHKSRGENEHALELLNEALEIAREIGDRYNEGVYLGTIGQIYKSRGENEKALEFLNEALDIAREIGNRYIEGVWLGYIGELNFDEGRIETSLKYLHESIEIIKSVEDIITLTEMYSIIGSVYSSAGENDKALNYLQDALSIACDIEAPFYIRKASAALGDHLMRTGKPCDAVPHYREAITISRKLGLKQYIDVDTANFEKASIECDKH
jgi:tetratricopeptide (TPR) repeat protein